MTEKLNAKFKKNNIAQIFNLYKEATKEDSNKERKSHETNSNKIFMWDSIIFSQFKGYPRLNFVINKVNNVNNKVSNENFGSVLQKLTKVLQDNQIFIVTLAKDDKVFKYVKEEKLIKIYNSMNKYRQRPIKILLFKQPERILEKS